MDLASTWQNIAGNGFMFWSATGAVALGITLILASGFLQVRRFRARAGHPVSPAPAERPEPATEVVDISSDREMEVESWNTTAEPGPGSEEQNSRELRFLLARLRSAADQLEDFRRIRREIPLDRAESSLKDSRAGVDYLFRTGTG